ncbi:MULTISPECIES: copper chaperone PCu(A)C [unclassified Pseudomonas]|uniref:copper chaperone PCu(A)C n=1 Tax=Pseudomonas TaxID=286 RepID=UPI000EFC2A14|nr:MULTISPECIES: copper chaperone PCu(A)C [unclassified Pseudomonas]AYN93848.1 copper chaperone PCu(A)C [Pseudomonas sp. LTJR-52]MDN3234633.1 copper chaperone PCu(A)C [Pseudomonas sp. WAC2]
MRILLSLVAALLLTPYAMAHEYETGQLHIDHPWSRATPPGAPTGAVYFVVHNHGKQADRLLSADSPVAASAELHTTINKDGMMGMRHMEQGAEIASGAELRLEPQGNHLMLVGLKQPLVAGQRFPLTLHFEKAGNIEVQVAVQDDAPDAHEHHHQH